VEHPRHPAGGLPGTKVQTMKIKFLAQAVIGGLLLVLGLALLVLPGPGLLLVLGGLILLSNAFPRLGRYVGPVRARAMKAAEVSVSSGWRIAGSAVAGFGLIAAGIVWGLVPGLPFSGWQTGSSIILSGIVLFALLIYSHRRVNGHRDSVERDSV
jgi:Putative transmembrane protein (PGPGW)